MSQTEQLSAFAARLPVSALNAAALEFMNQLPEGSPWAVACSGGADSVCLLLALYMHFPERRDHLRVLHLNHGMRGREAAGDAAFVESLAAGLGLSCKIHKVKLQKPSEAALRAQRLAFFDEALAESGGRVIFTAHHQGDVAETLLMRLTRGSSSGGLAAPRPIQFFTSGRVHVRPFLDLPKASLTEALEFSGFPWREDASNREPYYFRNRVRMQVLPALEKAAPNDAAQGIALSRVLLEEEDEALGIWLKRLGLVFKGDEALDLSQLKGEPKALWRRALNRWLGLQYPAGVTRAACEDILEAAYRGRVGFRLSIGPGLVVELKDQSLAINHLADMPEPFDLGSARVGDTLTLPDGGILEVAWEVIDVESLKRITGGAFRHEETAFVALPKNATLQVRSWRSGDRYHPLGAPGHQKLQDLFTNKKIPILKRHKLPIILTQENEIVWVPGLPPADLYRLKADTQGALRLTYRST